MKRTLMQRIYLLYLIIFFEGFTVLGAELTAIRQLLPFVGGATDIVAIVIAAVLVPLAFGYEAGGRYRKSKSFRKRLLINMTVAAIFLSIGLSYIVLEIFFSLLIVMHITHPLIQTILYCAIFLVTPIYLLGQTIPLCMHFLPKGNQSKSTGLVLFFSTVGSFLGSIVSTLVIMPFFGVNIVVITLCGILLLMLFLLLKDKMDFYLVISGMFFLLALSLNHPDMLKKFKILYNNQYNMAAVLPDDFGHSRVLMLNRYHAAKYTENPELRYGYIHYVEDRFITPIITGNTAPKSILVIGAGGFTFGKDDRRNAYTFVDIDPELKDISEKYLLKHKLDENKKFVASDARTFVRNNKQKYDLIFLDAFNNPNNIPAHLITREFFQDVRNVLAPGGRVVFNAISSPTMSDRYSVNIANTFNAVFPNASRQIIQTFDGWKKDQDKVNIIYMFFEDAPPASEPYQDRKNPFFYDMKK